MKISSLGGGRYNWYNMNFEVHSFNDQPAIVKYGSYNELSWYKKHYQHRGYDKPAAINMDTGNHIWYVDGKFVKFKTGRK